jgi:hypothetical protein
VPESTCSVDGCDKAPVARGMCRSDYGRWHRNRDPALHPLLGKMDKFWAKVDKRGPDECWLWTGALVWDGYPRFKTTYEGEPFVRAHRFAYRVLVGPIPAGYTIDHLCHTDECTLKEQDCPHRRCCNPAHLEPVTGRDNTLRGNSVSRRNAEKTHCLRGHPLSGDNLYVSPAGDRNCRTCQRAKHKRRNQALKEERRRAESAGENPLVTPPRRQESDCNGKVGAKVQAGHRPAAARLPLP